MSNFQRVNEYRVISAAGETAIQPTGHGVRLDCEKVTFIYQAGVSSDEHNVFTVYLDGARPFITDWSGVQTIGNHVRVNEYRRLPQLDGSTKLQYTSHGVRVNPRNVVKVYTAGLGLELDGVTTHECFRVSLVDGSQFITDWAGWQSIQSW